MYINDKLCKNCKGKCCKYFPGVTLPEDFGANINKETFYNELVKAFKSGKWAIDWIDRKKDMYFIRPAIKGFEGWLFDHRLSGECSFLTPDGCELDPSHRPSGCLLLEPKKDGICLPHLTTEEAAKFWKNYIDIIMEAAIEAEKIDFEF
ncbi:hypothetical protein JYK00_08425 [Thermosipho ferrireducens]|uniref:Zinc/iron-chelating domain-containing protein n=1 Tax=Thermosipho ferrireducens TaxID=2571116 RepID=A0ABX7S5D6_9BACT|nr:hypothetical protein [Thermosipho ferrireducens]QTA37738.1 hypothetical protein JYK00_08425 [Thermosipho ferrireducens]